MKKHYLVVFILAVSGLFFSCNKKETVHLSVPQKIVGAAVAPGNISGTIKGTMTSGNTYNVTGNITVNAGDTLYMQNNVHLVLMGNYYIYVAGTMVSNGSKGNENWITFNGLKHTDDTMNHASTDQAFIGSWQGILCDTSCKMLALHWTHLEYAGGATTAPLGAIASGTNKGIYFASSNNGFLIIEDCWIYGTPDDAVRVSGGRIWIARNTLEKTGYQGGDGFNAKSITTGDMCYNLCIGQPTNSTKASDKGFPSGATTECNINMYNNTYVDDGYRNTTAGKGANIDYEQQAEGYAYNNLIVDCKVGLRILTSPAADTNNCHYGNQFYYVDDTLQGDQIYPTTGPSATHPQLTDIPLPSSFLPGNYALGSAYNAPNLPGKNNPNFVNFPLPNMNFINTDFAEGFDFNLKSGSPCIGKGYTGFSPLATSASPKIPVDPINGFGATLISPPGSDIGAYQTSGNYCNQQTH